MEPRLPAHLEVTAFRRTAESMGGFATILAKGERDAGTIGLVIIGRGQVGVLYERMPDAVGNRIFTPTLEQAIESPYEFYEMLARRSERDPDFWLIEVDVPERERFVATLTR